MVRGDAVLCLKQALNQVKVAESFCIIESNIFFPAIRDIQSFYLTLTGQSAGLRPVTDRLPHQANRTGATEYRDGNADKRSPAQVKMFSGTICRIPGNGSGTVRAMIFGPNRKASTAGC